MTKSHKSLQKLILFVEEKKMVWSFILCIYFENMIIKLTYEGVTKKAEWTHPSQS